MFFDKYDVEIINGDKVVDFTKVIERISNNIEENLAYTPDYHDGLRIRLEDAEELMLELYRVIKQIK